jgi:peptidoglycan/xylan/chitin deacetylase (PgdA/CDA1 family)
VKDDVKIHLCFHGIGSCVNEREPGESRYWVGDDLFQRVLDEVSGRTDVELSFDDGNRSDVDIALPSLRDRGLRATFFPLAGRLDDPLSVSGKDLQSLYAGGMTIGSHGWNHVPWRSMSEVDTRREFVEARTAIEQASGAAVTRAAAPLGRYDRLSLRGLKHAGYATVYTSDRFPARSSSWLQARFSVTASDSIESVTAVLNRRLGLRDARNLLASTIKRFR